MEQGGRGVCSCQGLRRFPGIPSRDSGQSLGQSRCRVWVSRISSDCPILFPQNILIPCLFIHIPQNCVSIPNPRKQTQFLSCSWISHCYSCLPGYHRSENFRWPMIMKAFSRPVQNQRWHWVPSQGDLVTFLFLQCKTKLKTSYLGAMETMKWIYESWKQGLQLCKHSIGVRFCPSCTAKFSHGGPCTWTPLLSTRINDAGFQLIQRQVERG